MFFVDFFYWNSKKLVRTEHRTDTKTCMIKWGKSSVIGDLIDLNVTVNVTRENLAGLALEEEKSKMNSCATPYDEYETFYYLLLGSFQFILPIIALGSVSKQLYYMIHKLWTLVKHSQPLSMDPLSAHTMKTKGYLNTYSWECVFCDYFRNYLKVARLAGLDQRLLIRRSSTRRKRMIRLVGKSNFRKTSKTAKFRHLCFDIFVVIRASSTISNSSTVPCVEQCPRNCVLQLETACQYSSVYFG